MAEYIDRDLAIEKTDYLVLETCYDCEKVEDMLRDIPTADVIELRPILEEYEKLVQTKPTSKQIDEFCIKTMRKILCDYYVEKI